MVGRPINKDRQIALEFGFKKYEGAVHSKCGTTERYTAGGSCVHCALAIASEQREARKFLLYQAKLDNAPKDGLEDDDAKARYDASIEELM